MKYFLDTEFIEGFHKPLFGKRRHFIDLISIGIVAEDGREYYAVSTDFKPKDANDWVKRNVFPKLQTRFALWPDDPPHMHAETLLWKSNTCIKEELLSFFGCYEDHLFWRAPDGIEVYGYFADYDWVLFCSLFGNMMDLPKGFPMYCRDLKQMLDDSGVGEKLRGALPPQQDEHNALSDAKWNKQLYEVIIKTETK
jgi:hypothetical protein